MKIQKQSMVKPFLVKLYAYCLNEMVGFILGENIPSGFQ